MGFKGYGEFGIILGIGFYYEDAIDYYERFTKSKYDEDEDDDLRSLFEYNFIKKFEPVGLYITFSSQHNYDDDIDDIDNREPYLVIGVEILNTRDEKYFDTSVMPNEKYVKKLEKKIKKYVFDGTKDEVLIKLWTMRNDCICCT